MLVTAGALQAAAGEKSLVRLRDFCDAEVRAAGFETTRRVTLHIRGVGAAREKSRSSKDGGLFAYGWIINADTREPVWRMEYRNTSGSTMERKFDDRITLEKGAYEAYFTVPVFSHDSWLTHLSTNIDHRDHTGSSKGDKVSQFFKEWFGEDIDAEWEKRCGAWGLEILLHDGDSRGIAMFTPPRPFTRVLVRETGLGEKQTVHKAFTVSGDAALTVYALGEFPGDDELADGGWIVDAGTRERVWEMTPAGTQYAGGATKNRLSRTDLRLPRGSYVLYYISDDSHSSEDWNDLPPYDPLNWGVTLTARSDQDAAKVTITGTEEFANVIVRLVKPGDSETRSEGFTLTKDAKVRVYAIGERSNARRLMADYATILDARTRARVWTMDVDRARNAGGDPKNVYVDEVIALPRGSYIVTYVTDDSHSYGDWNSDPPFDAGSYGVTVTGAGEDFSMAAVEKYVEKRDRNIIAQIVRVGDDADRTDRFSLDRTTRIRVYALGEGQNRQMYDYGWIEDARTGTVVWEMTYGMTFHAGGHRKNRMVNTTIVLDGGEYKLHYVSDDSHCYNDWNVDQPEDPEFWGITLYREEEPRAPAPPKSPSPPKTPPPPAPAPKP
jgi:hypothetical protein